MSDVLILYASKHGHTAKIAERIAATMRADGVSVDLQSADAAGDLSPADYAAIVVGASIHAGHHQREIVDWAKRHQAALAEKREPARRSTSPTSRTRPAGPPTRAPPSPGRSSTSSTTS
jgi:menaquinone-dependent protoporphyrinogen IX oxidase